MNCSLLFGQTIPVDSSKTKFPICRTCNKIDFDSTLSAVFDKIDSSLVIVHIGDSHIQGDNFSGAIRQNLQAVFGNRGEGVLFPYSACKGYGPRSLNTKFSGTWACLNSIKNTNREPLGISGFVITTRDPHSTVAFKYDPTNANFSNLKSYDQVKVWHGYSNFKIEPQFISSQDSMMIKTEDYVEWSATSFPVKEDNTNFTLKFKKTEAAQTEFRFHGLMFENTKAKGIQYHHCGVVGATFLHLINNAPLVNLQLKTLKADLVIISFGSNESYDSGFDSIRYFNKVLMFVQQLKKDLPSVKIIFTTVPDTRSNNRFPVFTRPINRNIKVVAEKTGSAVWDLNAVMGGNNSMQYWYHTKMAGNDKLHFTKPGYVLQGDLFSLAFLESYNKYSEKKINLDSLRLKIEASIPKVDSTLKYQIDNSKVPAVASGKVIIHKIRSGETLSIIAVKYHVTVTDLCNWNNITRKTILRIGKTLVIRR